MQMLGLVVVLPNMQRRLIRRTKGLRYYVCKGEYSKEQIRGWAEENGLCLNGGELFLGSLGKVYGVDLWNSRVSVSVKVQGKGYQKLLNGTKQIGIVRCNSGMGIISAAIK